MQWSKRGPASVHAAARRPMAASSARRLSTLRGAGGEAGVGSRAAAHAAHETRHRLLRQPFERGAEDVLGDACGVVDRPRRACHGDARRNARAELRVAQLRGHHAHRPCEHAHLVVARGPLGAEIHVGVVPHHGDVVAGACEAGKGVLVHAPAGENQYQARRARAAYVCVSHSSARICLSGSICAASMAADSEKRRRSVPGGTVGVRMGSTW